MGSSQPDYLLAQNTLFFVKTFRATITATITVPNNTINTH